MSTVITYIDNTVRLTETSNTMMTVANTVQTVDTGSSRVTIKDRALLDNAADNNIIDLDPDPISDNGDMSFDSTYSYTNIYTNSLPTTSTNELACDTDNLVNNTHNRSDSRETPSCMCTETATDCD